jgi:uncharacterized protein (TIGR03437 family)
MPHIHSCTPFCILAIAFGVPEAVAQTAANTFFDDNVVQVINVSINPSDWATLLQNYLSNTYYPATMTWNEQSVTFGIRSHGGNGSRSPIKPNLDFNFAHYTTGQTFLGLPFILMKANNEDPSNLHEWISMKLYRKMGLPAPREAPAQLYINGQLLGFYYIVEHEDETFLGRDFGEAGGYLYEWEYGFAPGATTPYEFGNLGTATAPYSQFLDLKTDQASPNLTNFVNLIQAINAPSSSEITYIGGLSPFLDPKLFWTDCATEATLAEEDGVLNGIAGLNNFYLYQFQNSTLYQMIAWDKDRTFSDPNRNILDGITAGANINVLAQNLYGFADYANIYLSELTRAATLFGGVGGWADSEITREFAVIEGAALNDPNKQCDYNGAGPVPCGTADFEAGVNAIYSFISQRSAVVLASALSAGYQPIATNPQIQDVQFLGSSSPAPQVSPGVLATLVGTNLGPSGQISAVPLARILGATFVAVEGVRAPLLSTGSGQIGFQIPEDQATGSASVVASVGGAMSTPANVDTGIVTPVLLSVTRANGTVIAAGNAPVPGEAVTMYMLGLGSVTPDVTIGGTVTANSPSTLGGHPKPAIGGHLKTGQRDS